MTGKRTRIAFEVPANIPEEPAHLLKIKRGCDAVPPFPLDQKAEGIQDQRKQSYQLHIRLEKDIRLTVGRLGTFLFPAGRYIYTGSAKRNIEARVGRHLSTIKRMRWHIDYLLADPQVRVLRAEFLNEEECPLNQKTTGQIVAGGFGSSDCPSKCGSHLKYVDLFHEWLP